MSFLTRKKTVALAAVALASSAMLALSGCSAGSSANGGASTVTLFAGTAGNFTENFNPLNNTGAALAGTLGVLYEPLYYYNTARSQEPTPELASASKWNSDGTQLTITTRSGVKWSDGKPFSASDVAYTFNLIASNPGLNTSGAKFTVKQDGDNTVVLTFDSTSFTLGPSLLGNTPMIPEHVWSKIKDPTSVTNTDPVGTGPYKLKSFTPQSYVLTKNDSYWGTGADQPKVENVRYVALANADAATSALEAGSTDWMGAFLPTLDSIVKKNKDLSYTNTPVATTSLFTCANADLGCTGAQTDPAVRQAIYYAMDRTQMNKQASAGFSKPGSPSLLAPNTNKENIVSGDVELPSTANTAKAKSILEAAGYSKNGNGYYAKDGQEIDLTINVVSGWTDYDTLCTLLQGQLKQAGIKLSVNQMAQNAWTQSQVAGKFQLSVNSLNVGVSSSPYFIYNDYLSSSNTAKVGSSATTNLTRYSNSTVDAAIKTIAGTTDEATQKKEYGVIQQELAKDMPYIPIYVNSSLAEYNNARATGWPTQSNLYAFPQPWKSWDNGIVLKRIRPAK
ncbi:ABC transporter substrate-binding protein [Curtobacterium sp. MWU13-2055]|uniref:ABC transporter substrate-binding protein n=1 Tax=Curtobacterium sp. MWU13-2055 TaxID=2931928 RepID=UPI00200D4097|nr:ABC transporter substrate-binding protein [Curtobacterium sp. MWU13-2055]